MIVYKLKCDLNHNFECWFQNSDAYETQKTKGLLSCPFCNSSSISKAPMAPRLSFQRNEAPSASLSPEAEIIYPKETEVEIDITHAVKLAQEKEHVRFLEKREKTASLTLPDISKETMAPTPVEIRKALLDLKSYLKKNCEDVGSRFAEEARRIHYGESQKRNIYGQTTLEDLVDLHQEGIEVNALPPFPHEDA